MARRRVREAPLGPPVTVMGGPFGWCTTGQHTDCRKEFTFYEKTYQCSCKCHEQNTRKGRKRNAA